MCVLSPALFTTKRTEKFAEFEPEIVLKNNLKNGLLNKLMCVRWPALFKTKRAAKRVRIEREIVLKNNLNKAVDDRESMTYLTRRFNAESHVLETLKMIF